MDDLLDIVLNNDIVRFKEYLDRGYGTHDVPMEVLIGMVISHDRDDMLRMILELKDSYILNSIMFYSMLQLSIQTLAIRCHSVLFNMNQFMDVITRRKWIYVCIRMIAIIEFIQEDMNKLMLLLLAHTKYFDDINSAIDPDGNTIFHIIVKYSSDYNIIEHMLNMHSNLYINQVNKRGENALFFVNDYDIFELLISHGANPYMIDSNGTNLLCWAVINGYDSSIISLLLNKYELSPLSKDANNRNYIDTCASLGKYELLTLINMGNVPQLFKCFTYIATNNLSSFLIEATQEDIDSINPFNSDTLLSYAIQEDCIDIVEYILDHFNVNLVVMDTKGNYSILDAIIESGNLAILDMVIDSIRLEHSELFHSKLILYMFNNPISINYQLFKHMLVVLEPSTDVISRVVVKYVKLNCVDIVKLIIEYYPSVVELIIDSALGFEYDLTLIEIALLYRYSDLVQILYSASCIIRADFLHKVLCCSPFEVIIECITMAMIYMDSGCINTIDKNGNTPLHVELQQYVYDTQEFMEDIHDASHNIDYHIEIIKCLIGYGADVYATNPITGKSILDSLIECPQSKEIEYYRRVLQANEYIVDKLVLISAYQLGNVPLAIYNIDRLDLSTENYQSINMLGTLLLKSCGDETPEQLYILTYMLSKGTIDLYNVEIKKGIGFASYDTNGKVKNILMKYIGRVPAKGEPYSFSLEGAIEEDKGMLSQHE